MDQASRKRIYFPQVIDGLIILEEFSKEVAAITLVKYHMAS